MSKKNKNNTHIIITLTSNYIPVQGILNYVGLTIAHQGPKKKLNLISMECNDGGLNVESLQAFA
jgi:hypothetical protein